MHTLKSSVSGPSWKIDQYSHLLNRMAFEFGAKVSISVLRKGFLWKEIGFIFEHESTDVILNIKNSLEKIG